MKNRMLSVLLALILCIATFVPVSAASSETFSKQIVVKESEGLRYIFGKWVGNLSASKEKTQAVILVKSGYKGQLILDNVTIDLSKTDSDYVCALKIEEGANPEIVLRGKTILKSGKYCAGIEVGTKAKVRIGGGGSLFATGGYNAAGIGGSSGKSCGKIYIGENIVTENDSNPRITANGGANSAGIGGGSNGNGGIVEISGGLINAVGNGEAQDIGYGVNGKAGRTTVQAGRLLRYNRIDWDTNDSKQRQEIKFQSSLNENANSIYIEIESPIVCQLDMETVPLPEGGVESGVSYAYLPIEAKTVTLTYIEPRTSTMNIGPYGQKEKVNSKYTFSESFDISENKTIDFTRRTYS